MRFKIYDGKVDHTTIEVRLRESADGELQLEIMDKDGYPDDTILTLKGGKIHLWSGCSAPALVTDGDGYVSCEKKCQY